MARKYITAEEFKNKPLGVALRQYSSDQLDSLIEIATEQVESYCERVFEQTTYTETFIGDGTATYLTNQYPITSITSLSQTTIATTPVTTTVTGSSLTRTTDGDKYGKIILGPNSEIASFSAGSKYTIVYAAGYATLPPAIKHATALFMSELLKPDYGGAQDTVPEIIPISSQQIADLLGIYRRRRIGV
jgi:hypothetical protein